MSLHEAEIIVECDECGDGVQIIAGTFCGEVSKVAIRKAIEGEGWSVEGSDRHLCPDCHPKDEGE